MSIENKQNSNGNYIYGQLNNKTIIERYTGNTTDTAEVIVDDKTHVITANVKRVPYVLSIVEDDILIDVYKGDKETILNITKKLSNMINDAGFITKTVEELDNFYNKLEIDTKLEDLPIKSFKLVDELPEVGNPNYIYLLEIPGKIEKEEYIWIEDEQRYELIGTTQIDLSDYCTKEELANVENSVREVEDRVLKTENNITDINTTIYGTSGTPMYINYTGNVEVTGMQMPGGTVDINQTVTIVSDVPINFSNQMHIFTLTEDALNLFKPNTKYTITLKFKFSDEDKYRTMAGAFALIGNEVIELATFEAQLDHSDSATIEVTTKDYDPKTIEGLDVYFLIQPPIIAAKSNFLMHYNDLDNLTKCEAPGQSPLASEEYVDKLVGDIDKILDYINGEVV